MSRNSREAVDKQRQSLRQFYQSPEGIALKQRLSELAKINKPHLGHKHSSEAIAKMRNIKLGKKMTDETRIRMSVAHRGIKRPERSEMHKKHLGEALRRLYSTPEGQELRRQIDDRNKGNNHHLGHRNTSEAIGRMRAVKLGKFPSDKTRKKMSTTLRSIWTQSIEYKNERVGNIVRGNKKSPNSKELAIWGMLDDVQPNTWHFIGNGKKDDMPINAFWGKMPDFWNGDHKFVEHYGVWWHRNHNPQDRIDLFANHGCKMLIIQEMELMKEPDKVKAKIAEFVGTKP